MIPRLADDGGAPAGVVIVGAGQAGMQAAQSLRDLGFAGKVTLIGDEPGLPYQRPPLTKALLLGSIEPAGLVTHPAEWLDANAIDYRPGLQVRAIDRAARCVALSDGNAVPYTQLVLATGARNRELTVAGAGACALHHVRTHVEASSLRAALATANSVAVIGAGFLGLEAAACAAAMGRRVTIIDVADRVLARSASRLVATAIARHHRDAGIDILLGQSLEGCTRIGDHVELSLLPHGAILADVVLVAIGVVPNTELADAAGLAVSDGIVVDHRLRTTDPYIWAIGDCARFRDDDRGGALRIESVQNAVDQGRFVAAQLLAGGDRYDQVPLFWSDQHGLRLQTAGIVGGDGDDRAIVRGDMRQPSFSVYHLDSGRLLAVESVNDSRGHMLARKLLAARAIIPSAAIEDPTVDLRAFLVPAQGVAA
ncbi:NAD(P)/FAD-dependent oxidoreductase [Sphingomonas sp.]|uniref:NAD(P)/FAD-dependent oxidoreductase n=1 Tax=Sphingomonas sp. TaxID=28214 RepID=UPI002DD65BA8|nr:FAD-dependent oxidoreductase [Sphingomonas sp.]